MEKASSTLWYQEPAKDWNQALPVGNGKLGAMVFGGTVREQIQLNEDSVWSGGWVDRNNPDCASHLEEIRSLLRRGETEQAELLACYAMTGIPETERSYQTLGDLYMRLTDSPQYPYSQGEVTQYRRELCLSQAVCRTTFQLCGVKMEREVFASQPQNVLVIRWRADQKGALNFHVKMERDRFANVSWKEGENRIAYEGTNGGEAGIHFCCMLEGRSTDGQISAIGEYLVIRNATEVVLYLTAATSFREENRKEYCRRTLEKAAGMGYSALWQEHLQEYQPYFQRSSLELNASSASGLPTDQRLEQFRQNQDDSSLLALYYQYGRYLLIASSRPGTLPANLQGIWNKDIRPAWDSKYTININTEMNYWPAEICNLSDCHLPLFEHLKRMYPKGRETAEKMYRARGWVAHHNTDIWGDTAPQDTYLPATYWVMGAAWLCTHLWEHYAYTLDREFLKDHFYLIREACQFFLDYGIGDTKGRLIISPTVSPENTYFHPVTGRPAHFCEGCAMDSQILTHLFQSCLDAGKVLGLEDPIFQSIGEALKKLPVPQIDSTGRIQEWTEEYREEEPGHRHISHLYALYPGTQITVEKTPALAAAARKTLEHRLSHGGGHTGWSRAWIANFWAALRDSEKAQENLELLLIKSTLPNLFDNHPPFQIDGNFGGIAAIARTLLQSTADELELFPALPPRWTEGTVKGLCAKGNVTVDLIWKKGALCQCRLQAPKGYSGRIRYAGREKTVSLAAGESLLLDGQLEMIEES